MKLKDIMKKVKSGDDIQAVIRKVAGGRLGEGAHRDVYVLKGCSRYVIKIEKDPEEGSFCNVGEWRNWIYHKEWKGLGEYLAPIHLISETGQWMIQSRVRTKPKDRYPTHIPSLFTDTKYSNFGWIGKRFVCCDYPFLLMGVRLYQKKAKWWE